MSQQTRIELLRALRQSISQAESSAHERPDDRMLQRVRAYLWMAYDELQFGLQLAARPGSRSSARHINQRTATPE
jgi:hypothetical protein